jgi:hypothetical protein
LGGFAGVDRATSLKHVAAAISEDQKVTHRSAGMTISPWRIGHVKLST